MAPTAPEKFPSGYYEVSVHPTQALPADTLIVLRERLSRARRIKLTGWTPFLEMHHNNRQPIPFNRHIEAWVGRRADDSSPRESQFADYWRASRKGQLYTIRGYTEDSLEERRGIRPGTVVDVTLPVWRIGEVLYFASRFIDEFDGVQEVLINCQFTGLFGRTITSITHDRWTSSRPCHSAHVETAATVAPQRLKENMVEIVHQMLTRCMKCLIFTNYLAHWSRKNSAE